MAWLYNLDIDPNKEQQANRRHLLDAYGQFAQLSILLLPLVYQLSLAVRLILGSCLDKSPAEAVKEHASPAPSSPKKQHLSTSRKWWRSFSWVLDEEIKPGWGTRKQCLIALLWASWLMLLVFKDTGDDYIHVTRRFGIVAASQLPIHYLLALKAWSPIQYITRMSHEELNPYHRLLGQIVTFLMICHASLYLNFYVQRGFLSKRIQDSDVLLGLCAISTAIILFTTALARVRTYNYRLFFYIHVILSISLLPILYLHVSHLRLYILETAAIYIVLIVQRNVFQVRVGATIQRLDGTALVSVTLPLSTLGTRPYAPGQHSYIAFPTLKNKLRLNPFTIAGLPNQDRKIQVVGRVLAGTTLMLDRMVQASQPTPLLIEGPYGAAKYFPQLDDFDSVLLVAGGVGATFTIPIYRQLLTNHKGNRWLNNLRFVWVVKKQQDAMWGMQRLMSDAGTLPDGLQLYLTGHGRRNNSTASTSYNGDMEIELQEGERLMDDANEIAESNLGAIGRDKTRNGRPDLRRLVDETFAEKDEGNRMAILVCGPSRMGAALRKEVGRWVLRGRDVFWHNEEFGW